MTVAFARVMANVIRCFLVVFQAVPQCMTDAPSWIAGFHRRRTQRPLSANSQSSKAGNPGVARREAAISTDCIDPISIPPSYPNAGP